AELSNKIKLLRRRPIRVPAFLPVPGTEAVVVPFGGGLLLRLSDECKHKKRPGVIFFVVGAELSNKIKLLRRRPIRVPAFLPVPGTEAVVVP
ncbi:hypothetical protein, partial [Klebsiella pneumoniae]|uniref:hypothetical protein n=1 Tax=Klebsiella pneumoniae TaxID=573 RepID=UPI0015C987B5